MKKRLLSLILALCIIISFFSFNSGRKSTGGRRADGGAPRRPRRRPQRSRGTPARSGGRFMSRTKVQREDDGATAETPTSRWPVQPNWQTKGKTGRNRGL